MFQKLSIALVPVLFSSSVFAAQVFQTLAPTAGQSEVTPMLGIGGAYGTFKSNNDTKLTASLFNLGVSYYYGLADGHAVGGEMNYLSTSSKVSGGGVAESTSKSKGIANPTVKYKGLFETGAVTISTQVGYKFGLEKEKYNSTDDEGNTADGQNSFLVDVGVYAPVSEVLIVGGFINYEKNSDGESTTTASGVDSTSKQSGGGYMHIKGFVELQNLDWRPNFTLGAVTNYSTKTTSAGGTVSESKETHGFFTSASARFQMQPNFSINPEVSYQSITDSDTFDTFGILTMSASARFLF